MCGGDWIVAWELARDLIPFYTSMNAEKRLRSPVQCQTVVYIAIIGVALSRRRSASNEKKQNNGLKRMDAAITIYMYMYMHMYKYMYQAHFQKHRSVF